MKWLITCYVINVEHIPSNSDDIERRHLGYKKAIDVNYA